ncbi:unnamed protein product [Adineta steineri]|uniref:Uncharacterized protein n=1 Tax=Adineta steineri TaxID=433720 RepID=A0A818K7I1_9BILA|nr:unnamed protein product [Adineta steineri]CAF3551730.1 unnamed protein product [Adineta steineri]
MIISTNSGNALPVRLRSIFTANKSKWSETGHLNNPRLYHAASLLLDGKVLVTGGEDYDVCSTAELYDPISRNWTKSYDMTYCRWFHTATTLKNGKVLIAGGAAGEPEPLGNVKYVLNQAELYETSTGYWFHTTSMNIERYFHTASLLQNGNVLVVGGSDDAPNSAEVYEPEMETWINTTDMHYGRKWHTATVLKNGQVLVTGGHDLPFNTINSAEIYDPSTDTWKVVGSMNYKRYFHTATLLTNGKVLVAGGLDNDDNMVNSTELFDPSTESWTITGNMTQGRYLHTASLLKSGKVLVSGGGSFTSEFSTDAELYDFSTGMWTNTSSMNYQRASHTATVLADGNVLVIGEPCDNIIHICSSQFVCLPLIAINFCRRGWFNNGRMNNARWLHTASVLSNRKVLVIGRINSYSTLNNAELYDLSTGIWTLISDRCNMPIEYIPCLLDDGRILVTDGHDTNGIAVNIAQLYC